METTISITIKPSKEISDLIIQVRKLTGVHYQNHEETTPHITLYSCKFDESQYPELLQKISEIKSKPLTLTLTDLIFEKQLRRESFFVYFNIKEKKDLQNLHERVFHIVNPLRGDKVRFIDEQRFKEGRFNDEEFDYIKKHGFFYVLDKYNPHITIGVMQDDNPIIKKQLKDALDVLAGKQFFADRIYIRMKNKTIPDQVAIYRSEVTEVELGE